MYQLKLSHCIISKNGLFGLALERGVWNGFLYSDLTLRVSCKSKSMWLLTFRNIKVYSVRILIRRHNLKRRYSGYLQRSLRQVTFEDIITKVNKWAPKCPNCGRKMTLVCYVFCHGPPRGNEDFVCKLSDWNHPMLSLSYKQLICTRRVLSRKLSLFHHFLGDLYHSG